MSNNLSVVITYSPYLSVFPYNDFMSAISTIILSLLSVSEIPVEKLKRMGSSPLHKKVNSLSPLCIGIVCSFSLSSFNFQPHNQHRASPSVSLPIAQLGSCFDLIKTEID